MKKILVIQLARYGDIFQTWPVLRALRRNQPGSEIHCLVRQRFCAAMDGCEAVDRVWTLDTARILGPVIEYSEDVSETMLRLSEFTDLLAEQDFDEVINLSFSPFSSYLSSLVVLSPGQVRGYTRFEDGFLAIPDDPSAYFYAQVGIGRFNRYHLCEIFAAVAGVDLVAEDFSFPAQWQKADRMERWRDGNGQFFSNYVVVHLGASQSGKMYPAVKWQNTLRQLLRQWDGQVVLVGSENERELAELATPVEQKNRVLNLLGRTDFADLAAMISEAKILIGGDSAPMHLAGFTETPCLNLSFSGVNFWETGPRTLGSRIVFAESPDSLPSDRVVLEIMAMLNHTDSGMPVVRRDVADIIGYRWVGQKDEDFSWRLIQAIYSGGEWPVVEDALTASGMWQIREAAKLSLGELQGLKVPARRKASHRLIENSDMAIAAIGRMVPVLRPLVSWFETEKVRQGPNDLERLIEENTRIYGQLVQILDQYLPEKEESREAQP